MIVKCIRRCWDSKRGRRYHIGDQDEIDPLEPIAGNFEFPPGTEVYWKKPGTKTTPAISTTRIVPGLVEEKAKLENLDTEEKQIERRLAQIRKEKEALSETIEGEADAVCSVCGEYKGTARQVHAHKLNCKGKKD